MSKLNDKFLDAADWVSEAMGKPGNILVWAAFVIGWTVAFAIDKSLASSNFLPAWFTSQSYNFPLNLITTVAELFIGFLVAAATNRAQRALTEILNYIKDAIDNDLAAEKQITDLESSLATAMQDMEQRLNERISFINRPRLEVKDIKGDQDGTAS